MRKQYLFTERAHLMCPGMCFGIVEVIKSPFEPDRIQQAFEKLAIAHPFLRATLGYEQETNQYYYKIAAESKIDISCREGEVTSVDDPVLLAEYGRLTGTDWNLMQEEMLKVVCWKIREKTCVLFLFHHLLADGRAGLGLALEMAELYRGAGEAKSVPEHLIASKKDLPAGSGLPLISKLLIGHCNRKWIKENQRVTYEEYHNFANSFLKENQVVHHVDLVEPDRYSAILSDCKKNNVSVNDYLLAKMLIEENADKIILAQDIRNWLKCYEEGALGNYSTAFSMEYKPKSKDLLAEARAIHAIVKKKSTNKKEAMLVLACYAEMNPGLLDAAAISALGGYRSPAGNFVGGSMFGFRARDGYSITNLGRVENDHVDIAMFIPPASPAMRKIQGILTVNEKMVVCSSERKR